MAINLGAFLGAAAETGLKTYERLSEEEDRKLRREKFRRELEQEKALDKLYGEKLGKVGQEVTTYTPDMTAKEEGYYPEGTAPTQALPAGRAGANYVSDSDGMALKETKSVYTQKQALADIAKEAPVVGGRKGSIEAMQYKSIARASELDDKFDVERERFNTDLALINGTAESQGMKGLAELAKKNGLKVEFVEAKNGIGKINVLGPKGDVLQTITSVGEATQALEKAAVQRFQSNAVSLMGSAEKVADYLTKREELGIKRDYYAAAGEESRAKADYYRSGGSAGGGRSANEQLYKKAEELSKDKTSKFFGKKEDAYQFLKRGSIRNDDADTWNDIEKNMIKDRATREEIAAARAQFFSPERGYAPAAAIEVLRSGIDPKTRNTLTDRDLDEFNKRYPKTPWQDILVDKPQPPKPVQKGGVAVPR